MDTRMEHPHGCMRRKDREITDRAEIDAILREGKVMHLALVDGDTPFLVPLFYAFDGRSVFFHSARVGTKVEILMRNNRVRFAVSLDVGVVESDKPCDFEAKHRTAIGLGKAFVVESQGEKVAALDLIVGRFTERKFEYPKSNLDHTLVVRIEIDSIRGKTHGL